MRLLTSVLTTYEIAEVLEIARSSTTRKGTSIAVRTRRVVIAAAPLLAPGGRAQNATRSIVELFGDLSRLWMYDPERMAEWIGEMVGEEMAAP